MKWLSLQNARKLSVLRRSSAISCLVIPAPCLLNVSRSLCHPHPLSTEPSKTLAAQSVRTIVILQCFVTTFRIKNTSLDESGDKAEAKQVSHETPINQLSKIVSEILYIKRTTDTQARGYRKTVAASNQRASWNKPRLMLLSCKVNTFQGNQVTVKHRQVYLHTRIDVRGPLGLCW